MFINWRVTTFDSAQNRAKFHLGLQAHMEEQGKDSTGITQLQLSTKQEIIESLNFLEENMPHKTTTRSFRKSVIHLIEAAAYYGDESLNKQVLNFVNKLPDENHETN